ncbi:Leucine aminopeptidase 1 [Coemansia sp. RSA 2131]|nr:Leucine aminopeptidase 1 [Coemansia sp. RSA 2131]
MVKLWRLVYGALVVAGHVMGNDIYADKRRISLGEGNEVWMDESEIHALVRNKQRFRDITDMEPQVGHSRTSNMVEFPTKVTQQAIVNPLLRQVSDTVPQSVLRNLTTFHNRYYNGDLGRQSSEYLYQTVSTIMGKRGKVTQLAHKFPQSTVIARVEGTSQAKNVVVVSAHQDSINQMDHTGRAPGADDDGSGSVAILEAMRVLVQSNVRLQNSVEFHWYAGEEGGLLGSTDVVNAYSNTSVVADLHLDMVGFPASPPAVGIVTDYTDSSTSNLVRQLVHAYTNLPTADFKCGYACSDHASWHDAGVRSALPFESQFLDYNNNIHSPSDAFDTVDFAHLLKFVNIALGFIIEVAGVEA